MFGRLFVVNTLPLFSPQGEAIGDIVLLDPQLLRCDDMVDQVVAWRNAKVRGLTNYSKVTPSGTIAYLSQWLRSDRAFFLLFERILGGTRNLEFVGHIGLQDCERESCSLENFRRGRQSSRATSSLFFQVEGTLLAQIKSWGYRSVHLETMSYNTPLIAMHQEFGFIITDTKPVPFPMVRIARNGVEISEEDHKRYSLVRMKMTLGQAE